MHLGQRNSCVSTEVYDSPKISKYKVIVSENFVSWVNLAARVVRVVLARKDITYGELVKGLEQYGHSESEKSLASRVATGRVRVSLLLQILHVSGVELPALWKPSSTNTKNWEKHAQSVIAAEMAFSRYVDRDEVIRKLVSLGAGFTEKTLDGYIKGGTLFLPVFLRLLFILRSPSLEMFLDYSDVVEAATMDVQSGNEHQD
ncbi:hypothetical protein C798_25205 [Herbaspirillum rubrisubalbicans Os34]|uniref:DUF6471 domain-containing protein n=1 Tax=Herbaspirillum rubrisubalbicans Os34 TaxID=1235827 RepID=A0A6M4A149_9BURK|nr:hypothetical protein C798_25205 [Herbaspirillum rubrisubalbicans Os34]